MKKWRAWFLNGPPGTNQSTWKSTRTADFFVCFCLPRWKIRQVPPRSGAKQNRLKERKNCSFFFTPFLPLLAKKGGVPLCYERGEGRCAEQKFKQQTWPTLTRQCAGCGKSGNVGKAVYHGALRGHWGLGKASRSHSDRANQTIWIVCGRCAAARCVWMFLNSIMVTITLKKKWRQWEAKGLPAEKSHRFKGRHDAKKEQYGQIYVEKFTSTSLICKAFYGNMKT